MFSGGHQNQFLIVINLGAMLAVVQLSEVLAWVQ